ncbi:MAG TPA: DUF1990 family protein [Solirubrobacteraceae bacterium]|nr:DUF1990 family protein [Solirubrobacteraceae bacterium]
MASFRVTSPQAALAGLAALPVNFDPDALDLADPPAGWTVDDRRQPLPAEPDGAPVPGGPWEIAARLIRGYEFADPSIVRARYDPAAPLLGRDMLLELRALGLLSVYVGVRVSEVWDEDHERDGRRARVFGWAYRTLEGHVEQGEMGWQVWKWLDTGEVEFRARAVSRTAPISNPVIWAGFHLLRGYERRLYLGSTDRRMRELTARALGEQSPADAVRRASPELTARGGDQNEVHDRLAGRLEES